ncbi:EpsG family protein [Empedobacter sp.]|uniref:EpsG family protein n=1 Tax=Empedobacter sp. TaxID=1927715 RepID=UPI0028AE4C43|nr:EpsG family protein [Empedobacter sp.]
MEYFLTAFYLFIISCIYDFSKIKKGKKFHYVFSCILLICISGFRYRIAPDSITYLSDFNARTPLIYELSFSDLTISRYQPFWILLNSLCKTVVSDFVFFQIIVAIIINLSIFKFFKELSNKYFTCIFFYFIVAYIYFNMEIMRESLAISMCLFSILFYNKKKYKKAVLFFMFAFLFHSFSMFFGLIYVFTSRFLSQNFKNIFALFLILFILIIKDPILLIGNLFGGSISSNLAYYNTIESKEIGLLGYLYNLTKIILVAFVLYKFKNYKVLPFLNIEKRILINIGILYIVLIIVRVVSIPYMERILNYFTLFIILLLVSYFYEYINKKVAKGLRFNSYILLVVFVFIFNIFPMLKYIPEWRTEYYRRYYPYYSVFSKETDPEREFIIRYEGKEF